MIVKMKKMSIRYHHAQNMISLNNGWKSMTFPSNAKIRKKTRKPESQKARKKERREKGRKKGRNKKYGGGKKGFLKNRNKPAYFE